MRSPIRTITNNVILILADLPHLTDDLLDKLRFLRFDDIVVLETSDFIGPDRFTNRSDVSKIQFRMHYPSRFKYLQKNAHIGSHVRAIRIVKRLTFCILNRNNIRTDLRRFHQTIVELNPSGIVVQSNINPYVRILNKSTLNTRMMCICPSLVTEDRINIFIKRISKILNRIQVFPSYQQENYGEGFEGKFVATWSSLELPNLSSHIKHLKAGSFFFKRKTIVNSQNNCQILIVLHQFDESNLRDYASYRFFLQEIFNNYPNNKFILRYHPSSKFRFEFHHSNVEVDSNKLFDFCELEKYKLVLSSFSALAIQIGYVHPNTALFNLSKFDRIVHPLNSSSYFDKINSISDISNIIDNSYFSSLKIMKLREHLEPSPEFIAEINEFY